MNKVTAFAVATLTLLAIFNSIDFTQQNNVIEQNTVYLWESEECT